MLPTYEKQDTVQFVDDALDMGFDVEHYRGRFYWEGPAVRVEDLDTLQQFLANCSVKCQWDNMGRGYIVYPHQSEKADFYDEDDEYEHE